MSNRQINTLVQIPSVGGVKGMVVMPSETWNNMTYCGCVALPVPMCLIGTGALELYFIHKEAVDRGCETLSYMTHACGWTK